MTAHVTTAPARTVLDTLSDLVARLGRALVDNSDAMRCKREADRLFAMSDAELATLGVTRDRVIHRAFQRYLAI